MTLEPGCFVRLKTDPTRAGLLRQGERLQAGRRMVPVQFQDGGEYWLPADAIEPVPKLAPALADRFSDALFVHPGWLRKTLARIRVTGRLSDVVYSMEATATDFYAYQFKPVLKLLNSPTDALLIADEVGLGKTIEAGLIWTELRARLESSRLLVLCPKTLCEKWKIELRDRFGVDAQIVGARDLEDAVWSSTAGRGFALIASMQSLRPPRGWDAADSGAAAAEKTPRARLAHRLQDAAEGHSLLDLLVIDEAHHLRNPDTLLHQLGELMNAVSAYRIFLSATPIHLKNRDLHSLLRLIDPHTFEYESTLDELITANAPLIEARDMLLKSTNDPAEVLAKVKEAQQYDLIADSRVLRLLVAELQAGELHLGKRAELAARLEQSNHLANYITRTRRRDVQELRVQREVKAPVVEMDPLERTFYEAITEEVRDYAFEHDSNEYFLLATPQRMLSSSLAAASRYWSSHELSSLDDIEETDLDMDERDTANARPLLTRVCRLARRLGLSEGLFAVDSKYALLMKELHELWRGEPNAKVILFSSFKPTLAYLSGRLASDGVGHEILHGSVKEPRENILQKFKILADARVLLSSEVGSEGIDLQFCWIVINYDLPWNPMRLEQRIGRVDRLGQDRPKVSVLNLLHAGTIDDRIYQRLYVRLDIAGRALGEFETVLGKPIREMTQQLLNPHLNDEQQNEIIEQTAQAVAVRRQNEEELEAQAGSLLRHGDYILQKITESHERNRWLTPADVLMYVRDSLDRSFRGCSIETNPAGSDTYCIRLSGDARHELSAFLAPRNLRGQTRLLSGNDRQRYQFTSSIVKRFDGDVENISQVHPLVRFAAELDRRDSAARDEPVAASISARDTSTPAVPGTYVISVRRWIGHGAESGLVSMNKLAFSGARLGAEELLPPNEAETLVSDTAERGKFLPVSPDARLGEAAHVLRAQVIPDLERKFADFMEQISAEVTDRSNVRRKALERHLETKSIKLNEQRDKHRARADQLREEGEERRSRQFAALVGATEGKLRKLREACELRLSDIERLGEIRPEWNEVTALYLEISE